MTIAMGAPHGIAAVLDRGDTAINGRFNGENREVLEQMRQAERDAWSAVEHRLGDRELRENGND